MTMAAIIAAWNWIREFVGFWLPIVEQRFPFRIQTAGVTDPNHRGRIFRVTLINQTKDLPLSIRQVRIHYGSPFYSHAFVLLPWQTVNITPKAHYDFFLSSANPETQISQRFFRKTPPKHNPKAQPTFSSGADLFKAIANGNRRDSWIEVDFNEFVERRYFRGHIKVLFAAIIAIGPRFETMNPTPNKSPEPMRGVP
jgi:hypothetical protein